MSSSSDDEEETKRIRQLLKFYEEDFIKDLAVKHFVPGLLQELVLTYEDKQLIDGEVTHQAKAKKLLDILLEKSEKNPKALPFFKRAVQGKYDWLYVKLTEDVPDHEIVSMKPKIHLAKNGNSHNESSAKESSKLGWVQSLPPINIERPELIESLTEKIRKLKGNHYLVIHGMAGSGKTVLATQVIRNMYHDQHQRSLENEVYWLSMGKDSGDSNDSIIEKMRILCDKLDIKRAPESVDHGKEILRDALVTRGPVLLVLDNVWSSKVVKAFDVGFRTIVTTRDASVMDVINGRLSYNEHITEGFTEDESLNFFCKSLNIATDRDLPSQARLIHRECKGSPMVISLIASLLQDHQASGVKDSTRWEYYYDSLQKRKYSSLRRDRLYEHASISDAISLSFENLSEKERSFYQDFALFQHDVSVSCQVLETLWNVTKWKAEDIMRNFVRKSLAVEEYVSDRASFKYSLHDLQLDYLKTRISLDPTKEKDLHKRLIMQYGEKCNFEFHKLPNDGYIHFHLGYHLYKADQTELFPQIFLDLRFVGEKLKVTGPADLLLDFRTYRNLITSEDDASKDLLEELEELTHQVGFRLYGHADIDIMQVAMQSSHLRTVSDIARNFGKQNPSRLFLDWKNTSSYQGKSPEITLSCGDSVRCAKFIGCEGNLLISGLSNGEIKLCNLESCNILYMFRGHREAVNSLSIFCSESMQKTANVQQKRSHIFVSGSDDHTCRLWNLDSALECIESSDIEKFDFSPSPKTRQRPFSFDESIEFGFHTAAITCVDFSSDGEKIVSTSSNEILIWKASNRSILQKISTSEAQSCQLCYFSPLSASSYLLAVNENQICVISGSRIGLRSQVSAHQMKIVALIFRKDGSFCTVSENEIAQWDVTVGPIPEKRIASRCPIGPSVSVPLTNGAASKDNIVVSRSFPSSESLNVNTGGDFLHPDMALLGMGKRLSRTSDDCTGTSYILRSGMNSPTSAPNQSSSTGPVTTFIDTPDCGRICIKRAEILKKISRGLFTCAALDNKFGEILACGTWDQKIALFQLNKLKFLCEYSAHFGSITTLCFSPVDEFTLLSGSGDQTVKVWDLAEEEKENTEPQKTATFMSICVGDKFFVSICATERRTIQMYKDTELVGETVPLDDSITTVGLTKDGSQGAAGTYAGQVIWIKNFMVAGSNGIETEVIGNHLNEVVWMQFGTHKNVLATASYDRVLIFEDFHPQRVLCADYYKILSLHFAFQDSALAVCCEDGYIEMHKLKTDVKCYKTWKEAIRVSCFLLDGNRNKLYVGTVEDGIYILQLSADLEMTSDRVLDCKHRSPIRSLALTVPGDLLAVGHENGLITLWNISKDPCTEEMDLILHKSRVRHLCFFSKEPTWLLSCGDQLALWTLDKPVDKMRRTTFMEERRRRKSGDKAGNRLSMEIPAGQKIGRQGKRELLQTFMFRGNFAQYAACNSAFTKFVTVDNFGVFYFLEVLPSQLVPE